MAVFMIRWQLIPAQRADILRVGRVTENKQQNEHTREQHTQTTEGHDIRGQSPLRPPPLWPPLMLAVDPSQSGRIIAPVSPPGLAGASCQTQLSELASPIFGVDMKEVATKGY